MASRQTFLMAGGGTGGHVFPALAIAHALRELKPDADVVFAGTKGRIEARLVPEYGYRFVPLWISGVRRALAPGNALVPLKILVSFVQSYVLMKRLSPAAVVGTGGYVCGPVLAAATAAGIPAVIHESNSYPGITTRLLAARVEKVFLGFEEARAWLPRARAVEVVGTPTRPAMEQGSRREGLQTFGLSGKRPILLVSGGSQGARAINEAILHIVDDLVGSGVELVWQTGETHLNDVQRRLGNRSVGWVGSFIRSMEHAYAVADLVVARAGAVTIAELTRAGKPAVLIPFPHAAGDHQTMNARSLERAGAAIVIAESELERLRATLTTLMRDPDKRRRMARASGKLARPDAAAVVARQIVHLAGRR